MRQRDAVAILTGRSVSRLGSGVWADLGCGTGVFTRALASLLDPGSTIYAVDSNRSALSGVPPDAAGVRIVRVAADFTTPPWQPGSLNGVLMANSLHYVRDQVELIEAILQTLKPHWRVVLVEYDMPHPNRWVPYPVVRSNLADLFVRAGNVSVEILGVRPSVYQHANLYAARIAPRGC